MSQNDSENEPEWAAAYKHPVLRAAEDPSEENVEVLSKGQAVFALCEVAGVEPPEGNPDSHNGNIGKSKLHEVIVRIGEMQAELEDDE